MKILLFPTFLPFLLIGLIFITSIIGCRKSSFAVTSSLIFWAALLHGSSLWFLDAPLEHHNQKRGYC
jgi:hypothetical protein